MTRTVGLSNTVAESSGWWKPNTGARLKITCEPFCLKRELLLSRAERCSR